MRKILIADAVEESAAALKALLQDRCEVVTCGDGETALELLQSFRPDIFVLDLMLPQKDGLSVLQQLRSMGPGPLILAQTTLSSPYVMERLQQLQVDYVMLRPCRLQALEVRINDFLAMSQPEEEDPVVNDRFLGSILIGLGFSPKLDGFAFLLDGIPLYAQDPSQSITKELYAAVGEARQKDGALVERSIRSAIDKAWRDGDQKQWRRFFRCGLNGEIPRPSNGAFIARMAHLLASQPPGSFFAL